MEKYKAIFKTKSSATKKELDEIARLKDQHWPYGLYSQISWMNAHMQENDEHIMIVGQAETENILAYACMTTVSVTIDGINAEMCGIGNVCVDKRVEHMGYGRILMTEINRRLADNYQSGILLCKSNVVSFYKKCGWVTALSDNVLVADKPYDNFVMFYFPMRYKAVEVSNNF